MGRPIIDLYPRAGPLELGRVLTGLAGQNISIVYSPFFLMYFRLYKAEETVSHLML